MDDTKKRIAEGGGCEDWPCDYACLRRGTCDYYLTKPTTAQHGAQNSEPKGRNGND